MRVTTLLKISNLPPDEVHVHLLRAENGYFSDPSEDLFCLLPPEELELSDGFELEETRREFLWSRLLLHRVLTSYLGEKVGKLDFGHGAHGKPFLRNSGIQFNLSHTEGLIALSAGCRRVGIDIERMLLREKGGRNWKLLAERFFSNDEKKFLFSEEPENQESVFYKIFTLKEAIVKGEGKGIGRSFNRFSVPLPLTEKFTSNGWEVFTKFLEPGGFCLAHAVETKDSKTRYRFLGWTEATFENRFMLHDLFCMEDSHGYFNNN